MDASQASARFAAGMPAMLLCSCANQYRISSKSDKDFIYLAWLLLSLASTSAPDCDSASLEMRRGSSAFGPKQTSRKTQSMSLLGVKHFVPNNGCWTSV